MTKAKHILSEAGTQQETPLNIDLVINHERQDCETGTVGGGTCGRVKGRDEGEGIWLMGFKYK
jgi:hypothetical protein